MPYVIIGERKQLNYLNDKKANKSILISSGFYSNWQNMHRKTAGRK